MPRKITPSVRFRQPLQDALTAGGETFSYYCRQAAQAMLQTAMEAEAAEFIGRTGYQRRSEDQSVYRNGYKARKVATGEGPVELHVPQTRNGAEPFNTRILDAYRRRRGCPYTGGCGAHAVKTRRTDGLAAPAQKGRLKRHGRHESGPEAYLYILPQVRAGSRGFGDLPLTSASADVEGLAIFPRPGWRLASSRQAPEPGTIFLISGKRSRLRGGEWLDACQRVGRGRPSVDRRLLPALAGGWRDSAALGQTPVGLRPACGDQGVLAADACTSPLVGG